jgi:Fe2+ or Zn2+ uptake regulation protein
LERAMTRYAQQILDIINESTDHLTAEMIYLRLKASNSKVVLATVYNNLNLLYEQDMVRKVSVEGYPDRYDKIVKHDHLVCKKCGALSDICLSDLTAQLQAQIPEEIISYDLKVNYICPSCRSKAEKE